MSLEPVGDPLILRLYPAECGGRNTAPLVRGARKFVRIMLIGGRRKIIGAAEILLDLPESAGDFGLVGEATSIVRGGEPYKRFRVPIMPEKLAQLRKSVSH